jgi:hypothetical protein
VTSFEVFIMVILQTVVFRIVIPYSFVDVFFRRNLRIIGYYVRSEKCADCYENET